MTKQDKIFATLRKFDNEWNKKGMTFCEVVKKFCGGEFRDMTDDEVIQNIKDITIDKEIKITDKELK